MAPQLLPEIWGIVIAQLCEPTPRPTGKQERSSIRQNSLATCLRVSKLFNDYAAPLLYATIITDHLPSLAYNIGQPPAAKGIKSKTQLLGYMEHLYLECGPKDYGTYEELMQLGSTRFILVGRNDRETAKICLAEADEISAACEQIAGLPNPKLRSLATGAFLGGQEAVWTNLLYQIHSAGETSRIKRIVDAQNSMGDLVLDRARFFFCQRVFHGPLSFLPMVGDPPSARHPQQHCAHLELNADKASPPIIWRGNSRMYYGVNPSDPAKEIDDGLELLGKLVVEHHHSRDSVVSHVTALASTPTTIEHYLPPSMTTPQMFGTMAERAQRVTTATLRQFGIPPSRCAKDRWSYHKIEEAPTCEACGWNTGDIW